MDLGSRAGAANRTVLGLAGIFAATALIAFYTWATNNRFYIVPAARGRVYEVDRRTGRTWVLDETRKTLLETDTADVSTITVMEFPAEVARKINGTADVSDNRLSGKLYNGSDWIVTRVILTVSAEGQPRKDNGIDLTPILWEGDFSKDLRIDPRNVEAFSIDIIAGSGGSNRTWRIKKVFGYKERK